MKTSVPLLALAAALLFAPALAWAEDYVITLKDHQFSPAQLVLPTDQKVKVTVKNLDSTAAEFESSDLNREKVVGANSEVGVFIGPLLPGTYKYFDDFHQETTGTIVVK